MNAESQDLLDIRGAAASGDQFEVPVPLGQCEGLLEIRLEGRRYDQGQMDTWQQRQGVGLSLRRPQKNGSRLGKRRIRHSDPQIAIREPTGVAFGGNDPDSGFLQQLSGTIMAMESMIAQRRRPNAFIPDQLIKRGGEFLPPVDLKPVTADPFDLAEHFLDLFTKGCHFSRLKAGCGRQRLQGRAGMRRDGLAHVGQNALS